MQASHCRHTPWTRKMMVETHHGGRMMVEIRDAVMVEIRDAMMVEIRDAMMVEIRDAMMVD